MPEDSNLDAVCGIIGALVVGALLAATVCVLVVSVYPTAVSLLLS